MINKKEKLSLYLHIPFCVRKCLYCDFLSKATDAVTQNAYITALQQEMIEKSEKYRQYSIDTVFIGGGTPSILQAEQMQEIIQTMQKCFNVEKDAEITIEVNPGTVDEEKLAMYRQLSVNRLSIGLQSTQDAELKEIGRIHTYADFLKTFEQARKAGFRNINIDLMSALPGQTLQSYEQTIQRVLQLQPEHISAYSLIIEEGTPFYLRYGEHMDDKAVAEKGQYAALPDEDTERMMYVRTDEMLRAHGYYRYEISNYAKPEYACKHNCGYWRRHSYLGLGLGAASLVSEHRWSNETDLEAYIKNPCAENTKQTLTGEEQMEEFMFLGLRLMEGVSENIFWEKFRVAIEDIYGKQLTECVEKGLLKREKGNIFLTKRGIDVSNCVMAEFLF